jgi:hypothetical protein
MSNILLEQNVDMPNGYHRLVRVTLSEIGCNVYIEAGQGQVDLTWDQMGDPEYLAEAFTLETVRVFKIVVNLLGGAYSQRDLYKILLYKILVAQ